MQKYGLKYLLITLFYLTLTIGGVMNLFSPMILSKFTVIQPSAGDTVFNAIILEHVYKSFFDHSYKGTFYNPIFYYPTKHVLTFSDNLLGAGPIYWMLRIFADPLLAFQLWEIICVVLSFFAFIYLLRFLKVNPVMSGIIAFIFTFGAFKAVDSAHPQLYPQFYTFIFFVFLFKFFAKPSVKYFNLLMLFLYLQCLAGYYLGWFLVFSLFFFLPIYILADRQILVNLSNYLRSNYKQLLVWLAVWAVLFIIFWEPYVVTSLNVRYSANNLKFAQKNLVDIASLFIPPPGGIYQQLFHLAIPENKPYFILGYGGSLFLGLFGLFILFVGYKLFRVSSKQELTLAKAMYLTGVILLALTFKIKNVSLWLLVWSIIPGAEGIRLVTRIWSIAFLYIFSAVALYIHHTNLTKTKWLYMLMLVFALEQIIVTKPYVPAAGYMDMTNQIITVLKNNSCSVFYFKNLSEEQNYLKYSLISMNASVLSNTPTLNGYSGLVVTPLLGPLEADQLTEILENKTISNLCYILPEYNQDRALKSLSVSIYNFPLE